MRKSEKVPVQIGDTTLNVSPETALSAAMQEQRFGVSQKAGARREQRAERGLQLREATARQKVLEGSPEVKFFKETGVSPQALIGAAEPGYQAVESGTGKVLADVEPLKAGETLKDYREKATTSQLVKQTLLPEWLSPTVPPEGRPVQFQPKPGGIYRETEYKYPGSAKEGRPGRTVISPHPEGEFLRIGEKRIPYQEAVRLRNIAEVRRKEALDVLKSKPTLLPAVKERLAKWGYDPNDAFWGFPEQ
jgi:hypothetical protein